MYRGQQVYNKKYLQHQNDIKFKKNNSITLCCCNMKDGSMTVAIWSSIYALCLLFLFGWQTGVLSQCSEVTMAQANLKCEYYCPCVGASTARTSRIIEGLFIIQILCLIVAFFLLFASLALIYGIHNTSRFLIWPWFPCMISSILTSTAYCIMWWVGDVRDYWLAITICLIILQFINAYCFVVVIIYYGNIEKGGDLKDEYIGGQIMPNDYLGNQEEEYDEEIKDYNISKKDVTSSECKQNLNYYNNRQFIENDKIKNDNVTKRNGPYEEDGVSSKVKLTVCSCNKCQQNLSGKRHYKEGKRKYNCCEEDSNNETDITICNKKKYSYDNKKYDVENVMIPQNIYIPKTTGPQVDKQGNPIKNKYIIDSEYTFNY
uniref:MARVEL domain-containing protein n=1 Tax=Strongyloides stercoralis TaxID=6248 RepID=A0A0K0DW61_STRER